MFDQPLETTQEDLDLLRKGPEMLAELAAMYRQGTIDTLIPLLKFLQLKGQAYSLADHPQFEPLFDLRQRRRTLWKTGRQVSKTTGLAASTVLHAATVPHFSTLLVAPRFEQIRRVSSNYVRPFIETSLIANQLANKSVENSVLQKSFLNEAKLFFSFAFLDVERIRGISADCVKYDEIQDIDVDFIPVIRECMSASRYGIEMFFGTPLTLDNTIQAIWEESSQAEWLTRCGCGEWNIPALDHHLLKMIGKKGPVCHACGKQIQPRTGMWVHGFSDRANTDPGFHVPQIVMPMHYETPDRPWILPADPTDKWLELLGKRDGRNNFTQANFLNEVMGESCDVGVKLITLSDIKAASTLNENTEEEALKRVSDFRLVTLGVDWGGGGQDMISTTTCAVVGLNPRTGLLECIFAKRFHAGYSHIEEATALLRIFKAFQCHYFAHDYGGSGSMRETLMIQSGLPINRVIPFMYSRLADRKMVQGKRPGGYNQRMYYTLDKAKSLVLQAQCLKTGAVSLPDYNSSKDITHDLLALIEEKHDTLGKADLYLIRRNAKMSDDFAHALNYACVAIWHTTKSYPDLSIIKGIKLTAAQRNFAEPNISTPEAFGG